MENPVESKRLVTDEERAELCKKLEVETEEYFNNCKPSRYNEGWKEDTWEKEMQDHPLFASSLPECGELPPLLEALRQIKYDSEDNSPQELATSYKEDGNHLFLNKDYRSAIASYSEGIRQKTVNRELNAQLYLNRAAAQFHLNNFEASLADCVQAIEYKDDYKKAVYRAALCCWNLRKLDECMAFCDSVLNITPADKDAEDLKLKVLREIKTQERNRRKMEKAKKERIEKEMALSEALKSRGVTLPPPPNEEEILPNLTPRFPTLRDYPVSLQGDNIIWPVALVYPELKETDFIQRFNEENTISQMLEMVFQGEENVNRVVIGDESKVFRYESKNLNVWYKSWKSERPVAVKANTRLRQVIQKKDFVVEDGVPSFWVTRKDTEFEKSFLAQQGL